MFSRDILIDRINDQTIYTAERARSMDSQQQDPTELPIVYVGFHGGQRNPPVPIDIDYFNQHGEDIIQVFEVRMYCLETDLVTMWQAVYTAINGYTPVLSNSSTASVSGFAMIRWETAEVNGKIIDTSLWAIGFPSTNVIL
jgi:hypothetical protein